MNLDFISFLKCNFSKKKNAFSLLIPIVLNIFIVPIDVISKKTKYKKNEFSSLKLKTMNGTLNISMKLTIIIKQNANNEKNDIFFS